MDQLIEQMKVTLASTFTFYLKAHAFHWNVEGSNFPQYHEFFGDIWEVRGRSSRASDLLPRATSQPDCASPSQPSPQIQLHFQF